MASLRQLETADDCWKPEESVVLGEAEAFAEIFDDKALSASRYRQDRLSRTIESEIIPRLLLAHGKARQPDKEGAKEGRSQPQPPSQADIVRFAEILLANDIGSAWAFVDAVRARGTPLESVFLDLFAPAARHLGGLWEADLCDFVDVTLGLSRLQQLLRDLSPVFESEGGFADTGRRVLLIPAPGEQHTFGLAMVEEFFRRAGWEVWVEGPTSADGLVEFLRGMWFGVIGMSVSGDRLLDQLAPAIQAIRRESLNRSIGIMVGGRIFVEQPELVAAIGADATASDARQAVVQAQALLGQVGGRS